MKVIKPKAKAAKKATQGKKLPPDTYTPLMEPSELVLDETGKFVCSVQRGGDEGLPRVDIRTFQTTEAYTGFTRKGINFSLEMLPDLIAILEDISEKADNLKLYSEFEA